MLSLRGIGGDSAVVATPSKGVESKGVGDMCVMYSFEKY